MGRREEETLYARTGVMSGGQVAACAVWVQRVRNNAAAAPHAPKPAQVLRAPRTTRRWDRYIDRRRWEDRPRARLDGGGCACGGAPAALLGRQRSFRASHVKAATRKSTCTSSTKLKGTAGLTPDLLSIVSWQEARPEVGSPRPAGPTSVPRTTSDMQKHDETGGRRGRRSAGTSY